MLGVIIVGIAIVIGAFPAFVNGLELANKDAVTHDCIKIASAAQGYYQKDPMLGGGGQSFDGITIQDVGMYANLSGKGENDNGIYEVTGNGDVCTIVGYSKFERDGGGTELTCTIVVRPAKMEDPVYAGW